MMSSPEFVAGVATDADELGFESLWVLEHMVIPADYAPTYPYGEGGRLPFEDADMPDPLGLLAFIAACTHKINLGTGILILPQRHPVICAKECATVDVLSGGRLLLGIGVGWLREEAEAVGTTFDDRGERTDEYIEAMRALWRDDEVTFHGRTVRLERAMSYPKPTRRSIPILVGGHSRAAARRAGRLGDGWYPLGVTADIFGDRLRVMREAAEAAGRDPDAVEITHIGTHSREVIEYFAGLGVTRCVLTLGANDLDSARRALEERAEAVALFRD